MANAEILAALQLSDTNTNDAHSVLSSSELDDLLQSIPTQRPDDPIGNTPFDFDIQNLLLDPPMITSDDLFVEMLLNSTDGSSSLMPDESFFADLFPVPSPATPLPRITSVDEFDAFLRDFTVNLNPHQHELMTPIG